MVKLIVYVGKSGSVEAYFQNPDTCNNEKDGPLLVQSQQCKSFKADQIQTKNCNHDQQCMSCYLGISCSMNSSFVLLLHLHPNQSTANDIITLHKICTRNIAKRSSSFSISYSLLAGFSKNLLFLVSHGLIFRNVESYKPPIYLEYNITRKDLPSLHLIFSPQSISLFYNQIFYRLLSVQHVTFKIISCGNRFQYYSQHRQSSSTAVKKGVTFSLNLHLITSLRLNMNFFWNTSSN